MAGDYEIIDAHVHLVRDGAQEKVVFPKKGWPESWYWCNPDKIIRYMDLVNCTYAVVPNIMATARMTEQRIARLPKGTPEKEVAAQRAKLKVEMIERVRSFNTWICDVHREKPRIIPLIQIDPVLFGAGAVDELERCLKLGARGVKLHPTNCMHMPDHPNMLPVYQRCQELGLPILTDSTGRGGPMREDEHGVPYGYPAHWRPILSTFPRLNLIIAHLCDIMWDQRYDLAREFKDNVVFDMSGGWVDEHHPGSGHGVMPAEQVVRVFRKVGIDRILFGSDAPGAGMGILEAASQVVSLPFTEEEKRMILSQNAKRVFGLK